jgi:hypothetical protein
VHEKTDVFAPQVREIDIVDMHCQRSEIVENVCEIAQRMVSIDVNRPIGYGQREMLQLCMREKDNRAKVIASPPVQNSKTG